MAYDKETLEKAVQESSNYVGVLRKLGLTVSGGAHKSLRKNIARLGVNTSHFVKHKPCILPKLKMEDVFKENGNTYGSTLRKIALRENIFPYFCTECKNTGEHNGKKLVLQLDHISGNKSDSRVENLRWLCPNCHSQTETYARTKTNPTQSPRRRTAVYITLICDECKNNFERKESRIRYGVQANHKTKCCSNKCKMKLWRKINGNYGTGDHGTIAGYFRCAKPRCRPCLDAMSKYKREKRLKSKTNENRTGAHVSN
jgi:hypothetical protein